MFSMIVDHFSPKTLVFIQYLMALAVVQTIKTITNTPNFPIFIKWPNDIYAIHDGKPGKIGGILVTSSYESGRFRLVVGCGVNVENDLPTVSLRHIGESLGVYGSALTRETVLASLLPTFEVMYRMMASEDSFKPFIEAYQKSWLHT
jgi:biotin--protein ligase